MNTEIRNGKIEIRPSNLSFRAKRGICISSHAKKHADSSSSRTASGLLGMTLALLAAAALLDAAPVSAQRRESELAKRLVAIVEEAIARDEIPGAVLLVGHEGKVIHRKAYGARAVLPQREAMTVDTIFDLASLTKPLATASSLMVLLERGAVRLDDPVARYIPEFAAHGKEQVTVRQLLTHTGGLRPVPRLPQGWSGSDAVLRAIYDDSLVWPPGLRFLYSDTGFIVLGELVRERPATRRVCHGEYFRSAGDERDALSAAARMAAAHRAHRGD
jgi:CubicO group peptidase (beta-lactamase class C family)